MRPALGRLLADDDDRPFTAPAVVLGYRYWQARFGGEPGVVGRSLTINGVTFTVVGVTAPGFTGTMQVGSHPAVFVPVALESRLVPDRSSTSAPGKPGSWWLHLMGRLRPGATVEQARDSLAGTFQSLALQMMPPPRREGEPAQLETRDWPLLVAHSGRRGMMEDRRHYQTSIEAMVAVVLSVLLIACANVATLLLARSAVRGPEMTVRLATGAGRARLVRQLMTETLLLSLAGGVAGIGFGYGCKALLASAASRFSRHGAFLPSGVDYPLNGRVLLSTLALSLATAVACGLVPALRTTRRDLTSALRHGRPGSAPRVKVARGLVVAQVALSLVLLVGTGLFLRTARNLGGVDVGFNEERLLVFALRPATAGYQGPRLEELYRQVFQRLDRLPGVQAATFGAIPPLSNQQSTLRLLLPGEETRARSEHHASMQIVRENYFETMQIPVLRGRRFGDLDGSGAPRVAVVNETLARRYFPGEEAVGKRLGLERNELPVEIVGVVRDTCYSNQREQFEPLLYLPWRQQLGGVGRMWFAVRAAAAPLDLVPAVRAAVREVEPALSLDSLGTQIERSRETFASERLWAGMLAFFGGLALLLAAIGLYAVLAYEVSRRTQEIGVRMALGATSSGVRRLVLGGGLRLVALGAAIGVGLTALLQRAVQAQLYGVGAGDPASFLAAALVLLAVAGAACWVPARRASHLDPMTALRED